ncbi:F-box protein: endocytic membrane traffic, recycling ReCYcling 1 [Actinomortierella wolfii]|nr:F-box protein: endocytic membrane traffic, recycling ReCYcling 1 [Actinomortierella wolfii]
MEVMFDVEDLESRASSDLITTSIPSLPPDILLKCLQYLPVSSIPSVALACRRLKVIAYSDALWDQRLDAMRSAFKRKGGLQTATGNGSLLDEPSDVLPHIPVQSVHMSDVARKRASAIAQEAIGIANGGASTSQSRVRPPSVGPDADGFISVNLAEPPVVSLPPSPPPAKRIHIPGLPGDPYAMIRENRDISQRAMERFKLIHQELMPYYVDFRNGNKDSKVIQEFGKEVIDVARMLAKLVAFSKANITEDAEQISENLQGTCEYFENRCLHLFEVAYDMRDVAEMAKFAGVLLDLNGAVACIQIFIQKNAIFFDNAYDPSENIKQWEIWQAQPLVVRENTAYPEFTPLRLFMQYIEMEVQKQAILINDVFPEEADVLYSFVERVFEDVIAEYCSQLFDECSMQDKLLYLKSVPTAYRHLERLVNMLVTMEPIHIPRYRIDKLFDRVFAPWLEKYLKNELDWVQKSCKDQIDKYERQRTGKKAESKRMNPRNREVFKRNFLKGFRNVITLPYKISSSIVAGVTSATSSSSNTVAQPPHPTPPTTATSPVKNKRFSLLSLNGSSSTHTQAISSAPDTPISSSSSATFTPETSNTVPGSAASDTDSIKSAPGAAVDPAVAIAQEVQEEEEMNSFLSVELALTLIHLDKDALQRLGAFAALGGVLGGRVATEQLGRYKPSTQFSGGMTPLMDFFELVHVADLILQMVQVYYAEEMCRYIDKMDFLNDANKEKKAFERLIDDGVAAGLDKCIEVLIQQVAHILETTQLPTDYNPECGTDIELQPTQACKDAVQCLTTHTKLLVGCADKQTLDVFFQEVGVRLFNVLTKHLKSNIVSSQGGFVLICDLNHYYNFAVTLKQPTITPHFLALKELGNVFIIQSPTDLKQLIHDMERFGGILRVEDVFEYAEMRADWKHIQRIVERDRLECIVM